MTHRSRSGGPQKKRAQGKKRTVPKLHHPPARSAIPEEQNEGGAEDAGADTQHDESDEDEGGVPPPAHFALPTNDEILTVLRWALQDTLNSDEFPALVQRAKGLLYERRWLELFTDPGLLDAYAGRWVPSRALCFRELLAGVRDVRGVFAERGERGGAGEIGGEAEGEGSEAGSAGSDDAEAKDEATTRADAESDTDDDPSSPRTHILSLGGGAGSELLAVAALASRGGRIRWTGVDVGAWGGIIARIEAAARDRWRMDLDVAFVEGDLLAPPSAPGAGPTPEVSPTAEVFASASKADPAPPSPPVTPNPAHPNSTCPAPAPAFAALPALTSTPAPDITTLFFTLTELLSQNRARTVALLRAITAATPRGGLLMVADSASDIAEFPLGKDGRTWPVYMVLDAIVGAISKAEAGGGWEKIRSEDSRWFRLSGERWPCKLENARYWLRVYRRV